MTVLHGSDLVGQNLFMEPEHDKTEYPGQDPTQVMEILLGVKGVRVIGMVSKSRSLRAVIETLDDEVLCSQCGVTAEPVGRPVREMVDLPAFASHGDLRVARATVAVREPGVPHRHVGRRVAPSRLSPVEAASREVTS